MDREDILDLSQYPRDPQGIVHLGHIVLNHSGYVIQPFSTWVVHIWMLFPPSCRFLSISLWMKRKFLVIVMQCNTQHIAMSYHLNLGPDSDGRWFCVCTEQSYKKIVVRYWIEKLKSDITMWGCIKSPATIHICHVNVKPHDTFGNVNLAPSSKDYLLVLTRRLHSFLSWHNRMLHCSQVVLLAQSVWKEVLRQWITWHGARRR